MASLDVFGHGSAVKVSPGEARRVRISQVGPVRASYGPSRCVESWKGGRVLSRLGPAGLVKARRSWTVNEWLGWLRSGVAVMAGCGEVGPGVVCQGESVCHS